MAGQQCQQGNSPCVSSTRLRFEQLPLNPTKAVVIMSVLWEPEQRSPRHQPPPSPRRHSVSPGQRRALAQTILSEMWLIWFIGKYYFNESLKSTQNIKHKNQNWTTLSAEKCTEGKSNFWPVDPSCKRTVPASPPRCSIQTMASLDVEYIKKVSLSRYSTILPPRYSTSSGKNLVENNNCLWLLHNLNFISVDYLLSTIHYLVSTLLLHCTPRPALLTI